MQPGFVCPVCQKPMQPDWLVCPYCGGIKAVTSPSLSTSVGKQIMMYSVSFFLAPLGLGWGIKYAKSTDPEAKRVGYVIIGLTVFAVIFLLVSVGGAMSYYGKLLNSVSSGTYTNPSMDMLK